MLLPIRGYTKLPVARLTKLKDLAGLRHKTPSPPARGTSLYKLYTQMIRFWSSFGLNFGIGIQICFAFQISSICKSQETLNYLNETHI